MEPRALESESSENSSVEESEVQERGDREIVTANLSLGPVVTTVIEDALLPDDRTEKTASTKGKRERCTPEVKALGVSAFLFALITVVQVFAARIAHSQALLMDCISMAVDSVTYLGNIVVECRKRDGQSHAKSQLIVVSCSLSVLVFFTVTAMQESWHTVLICQGKIPAEIDEDDVNGWITLAFALGGVGFDIACLMEFYKSNKKTGSGRSVNMFSAFLHVSADFLRSTSTLVMSLLILLAKVDSTCLDAYVSIFIGVTIICGAFVGFFKWIKLLVSLCLNK